MGFFHTRCHPRIFIGKRCYFSAQTRVLAAQCLHELGQLADFFQQFLEFGNHGGTIVARVNFRQYIQGLVAVSSQFARVFRAHRARRYKFSNRSADSLHLTDPRRDHHESIDHAKDASGLPRKKINVAQALAMFSSGVSRSQSLPSTVISAQQIRTPGNNKPHARRYRSSCD